MVKFKKIYHFILMSLISSNTFSNKNVSFVFSTHPLNHGKHFSTKSLMILPSNIFNSVPIHEEYDMKDLEVKRYIKEKYDEIIFDEVQSSDVFGSIKSPDSAQNLMLKDYINNSEKRHVNNEKNWKIYPEDFFNLTPKKAQPKPKPRYHKIDLANDSNLMHKLAVRDVQYLLFTQSLRIHVYQHFGLPLPVSKLDIRPKNYVANLTLFDIKNQKVIFEYYSFMYKASPGRREGLFKQLTHDFLAKLKKNYGFFEKNYTVIDDFDNETEELEQ